MCLYPSLYVHDYLLWYSMVAFFIFFLYAVSYFDGLMPGQWWNTLYKVWKWWNCCGWDFWFYLTDLETFVCMCMGTWDQVKWNP